MIKSKYSAPCNTLGSPEAFKITYMKMVKAFLMTVHCLTRPLVNRLHFVATTYYWADMNLYALKRVYVLPVWFYRCLTWVCNGIVALNTVDCCTLRSRHVQKAVNWLIHQIPFEIRFM